MSEVKRYEWGDDGMWEFNEQGRYVEASDHDHLISAKDALLAERDAEVLGAHRYRLRGGSREQRLDRLARP